MQIKITLPITIANRPKKCFKVRNVVTLTRVLVLRMAQKKRSPISILFRNLAAHGVVGFNKPVTSKSSSLTSKLFVGREQSLLTQMDYGFELVFAYVNHVTWIKLQP